MALVFMDGFDVYATSGSNLDGGPILRKWALLASTNPHPTAANGRYGSSLAFSPGNSELFSPAFTSQATWTCGFAYFRGSTANNYNILKFNDSYTAQCSLFLNSSNQLAIRNGTSGSTLATGSTTLSASVWYHVAVKVTINNSTGSVEIRLNGSLSAEAIATNVNTRTTSNNTANGISFSNGNTGNPIRIDDFYLCDTTGSSNTTFLGDMTIETLRPNGNGAFTQWTPSSGANYTTVNETIVNDDTNYVSTSTVNNIDTYTFGDLSAIQSSVKGVAVNLFTRKDVAGSRNVAPVTRINGTNYLGTTSFVADNYLTNTKIYDNSPATSGGWTTNEINNAEFGVKLIS